MGCESGANRFLDGDVEYERNAYLHRVGERICIHGPDIDAEAYLTRLKVSVVAQSLGNAEGFIPICPITRKGTRIPVTTSIT